ncbi:DUF6136 family protein [Pseudoalteromonas luteoviolacea]|uniref:Uncharacterized protein n=1 Tax=Pseudoalteromonas luteoviolacea (strain 2ta16) TaxID=1353533 RepID=V4HNN2_PSEL2|nr:DUF6136 family protein [Pseudoalteromonas luteoviolacea]ESP91363.1 hypothetical protein PL2TA16_00835 [Pseudoalteromonas luteoviolacea 2ta16]KZN35820.1 hypothetical protein N483_23290 [Pseudoalteromonas luteoviolacea NCIMB 1944]
MIHYYRYRLTAFRIELKALRQQLAEFSLLLGTLFFIYVPSLAMGVFFALGKIVQYETDSEVIRVTFGFLLLQSLLLQTVKSAVLDTTHRNYHSSILTSRFHKLIADQGLLLICHVLFLAALAMALAMGWQNVMQVPHLLFFMAAQLGLAMTLLYRPIALLAVLVSAFAMALLIEQITVYYAGLFAVLLLSLFLPSSYQGIKLRHISTYTYWLQWVIEQPWVLIWRLGMTILTYWCTWVIVTERPDLKSYYVVMAQLFTVLWWGTLLIDTNKQVRQFHRFWSSISKLEGVHRSQCVVVLSVTLTVWISGIGIFGLGLFEVLTVLVTPVLMWVILHSARYLALVWAVSVVAIMLAKVLVS